MVDGRRKRDAPMKYDNINKIIEIMFSYKIFKYYIVGRYIPNIMILFNAPE